MACGFLMFVPRKKNGIQELAIENNRLFLFGAREASLVAGD
jgi:hypothetical protein